MLFDRGYRSVLYFDPDIHFYADFDEVALLLHKRTFVLTPRREARRPATASGRRTCRSCAGVYNYGFLGLSNAYPDVLDHYLAWWAETLRYQGGTYKVLVDPRYNAAYWNLHYRGAEIAYTSDSDVTYGGAPWSSSTSRFKGRHAKAGPSSPKPAFADAILALDANPFATAPANSLWRWLFENRYGVIVDDCSEGGWLPNAALLLLDAFGIDTSRFRTAKGARTWFYHYGSLLAAHVLERKDARRPAPREAVRRLSGLRAAAVANKDKECAADGPVDDFGVNVVGYVDGVFGVAESSRYLYRGLRSNIPTAAVKLRDTPAYAFRDHGIPTTRSPGFGFNVVVQNADMSPRRRRVLPGASGAGATTSATGPTSSKLPERFASGALIYDEIWATSEFTADAVRSAWRRTPWRP
ncbi:glycosyl transferase [Aureococcus anophagefferens]|nr:glycosyl transferase [Aureococcus anophagefferens]